MEHLHHYSCASVYTCTSVTDILRFKCSFDKECIIIIPHVTCSKYHISVPMVRKNKIERTSFFFFTSNT